MTPESIHSDPIQSADRQAFKKSHAKFHFMIGVLLVIFLSIASVDFYYHYQEERLQKITLDELRLREKQQDTELYQTGLILRRQAQQLEEQEKNLKQWIGSSSEIKSHNEKIYAASEIKHWIRMVVLGWSVNHDVESALQLLQIIQVRLNLLNGSTFEPLKHAISKSVTELQMAQTILDQELYSQLLVLESQLDALPILTNPTPTLIKQLSQDAKQDAKSVEAKKNLTNKKDWLGHIFESIESMWKQWVIVSKDEEIALPLLSSSQRYLLNWYLHMLLTLAQTEAMDYKWRVCSIHLQQIIQRIQQFYSMENKEVQILVKQLTILRDKTKEVAQLPSLNLNKLLDEVNSLETRSLL